MPKVSDEHKAARRGEIIAAALRCFERLGVQRTSMADIIAESGLSAGAIYSYFPSKGDITVEVARVAVGSRIEVLEGLTRQTPPLSAGAVLRRFLEDIDVPANAFPSVTEQWGDAAPNPVPRAGVLVQMWGEGVNDEHIASIIRHVGAELIDAFANYISVIAERRGASIDDAANEARQLAPLVAGLAQGYMLQRALFETFDSAAYLDGVERLLR